MTRLTTLSDAEAVSRRAAVEIARRLQSARRERGVAHLALSGGTTPGRAYELLAGDPSSGIDQPSWDGVEVWFADERCVEPQDERSNHRLASTTLLSRTAGIAAERVHRMEGELGPEEGARRYERVLRERVATESDVSAGTAGADIRGARASPGAPDSPGAPGSPGAEATPGAAAGVPALDVVVLGIGPDGHVASLFPGAPTLDAGAGSLCLAVRDSPKPPPERITLSLPALRAARRCLLLATGASKADAVAAMLAAPSRHVPASLLRRGRLSVIVDDAAAPAPPRK